jgi:hypothetical protein
MRADISDAELHDAVTNLEFIAVRFKGIMALAEKMKTLRAMIADEREIRERLAGLYREQDAVTHVVAQGDAAQARLDGIEGELAQHRAAMEAERIKTIEATHAAASDVMAEGRARAAKLLEDGRAEATRQAEHDAAEAGLRRSEIESLDAEIGKRQAELAHINNAIAAALEKIGAR